MRSAVDLVDLIATLTSESKAWSDRAVEFVAEVFKKEVRECPSVVLRNANDSFRMQFGGRSSSWRPIFGPLQAPVMAGKSCGTMLARCPSLMHSPADFVTTVSDGMPVFHIVFLLSISRG